MDSEQTFSVGQVLDTLRKHISLIIVSTLLVTLISALFTFFVMTPKYSSTAEILVNRKLPAEMQAAQFQQVQADVQMISTYKDIIMSPAILKDVDQAVKDDAGYPGSEAGIKSAISISSQQNSQVFSISAKSSDPQTAALIANTTAKVFKQNIGKIMSINNVSVVSKASANNHPVSPRIQVNIMAGVLIGLLLGIALAFLREFGDRTVTSESFLTDDLELTSLGTVNEIDEKEVRKQIRNRHSNNTVGNNNESRMKRRV
ncbi:YveK family protein [Pediococcus argentinicus]|uniref:Capsular polysaccharide biosynthesis protein CpsC n=1 Tax=Pediococcus argentinicus TaxID=480391 RepID=A0A0R2N7I7_9LACO|nr:Wzz/FepE/Etk N-terminal domain-containing protein [Pediococcus argentinicus]KRO20411.1 ywqC protein [Pediococcus argentinicus]NKZ22505.1 chain-length determining protein [Pediococcus argentinicus]GEP20398.1 tyrosine protein kinase [Pediococcus argentinicus]